MELSDPGMWILTVAIGLVAIVIAKKWWSSRNDPPGPWGLPVVGYLPFLGRKMDQTINGLAKKYGEVYQLKMGSWKVIVISGQKAIREALVDSGTTFSGRPNFYSYVVTGAFGFANYTPSYRLYKKNTMKSIDEFIKLRQSKLQHIAQTAAVAFIKEIEATNGEPIDPQPLLYRVTCSIIGYICYGKFFDINDKDVTTILDQGKLFGNYVAFGIICDFLPWAKFLVRKKLKQFEIFLKESEEYAGKISTSQTEVGGDGDTLGEIFHRLGDEMTESEKTELKIDDATVRSHVHTMFGAGFGTVAATLRYGLMIMALNPGVQKKVQEELDSVVGKSRYPDFEDRDELPYTYATVIEMHRHFSMSALGVTHATTCDTVFRGYSIPKDTPVIFNYYSINRGDIFSEADKFKPERFLCNDGSFNVAAANLVVPFGLGQRRCAGEQLARLEVFVFFATILQQCVIEESAAHPLDLEKYIMTFGRSFLPFKVIVRTRNMV